MTDRAAIAGNYSDFKLVKTRSVCQVVIELPLEKAEAFLSLFGVPLPGAERPVALALLQPVQKQSERPKQSWSSMSRAQQAGVLCADERFQNWIGVWGSGAEEQAANYVREHCRVASRRYLDLEGACTKWDDLVSRYRQAVGLEAERRA